MFRSFSLLMSAYQGDQPEFLSEALESLCHGTEQPDEIVMVLDGPVPDAILQILSSYQSVLPIRLYPLTKNQGLGPALAYGLSHCKHELVARFDTDDVCMPDRFERQLNFILQHPEIDACSSAILEFDGQIEASRLQLKPVPIGVEAVARYARWRNPLNHMAVMFRKSAVLRAGSYQDDRYFEDYALWVRMLINGSRLDNLPEPTVWARAGGGMFARRGGFAYARSEYAIQRKFWSWGFITRFEFFRNLFIRIPVRLLSSSVRGWFYTKGLRARSS